MGNLGLMTFVLVLGVLEGSAFSRQRRHYGNNAPRIPNCGKVSYNETGGVPNNFPGVVTGKTCRNIESATPTVLSLHVESLRCNYNVETYSTGGCDDDKFLEEHIFNSAISLVTLNDWRNRFPVCSYRVHYAPIPGDHIHVKFLEPYHNDKSQNVTQTGCYNLCDSSNRLYYPYKIELSLRNENGAQLYNEYVTLFSTTRCEYYDGPDTSSVIGGVRNGANLVALTSVTTEVRSYMIVRSNNGNSLNFN